jgi:hypothetical protein
VHLIAQSHVVSSRLQCHAGDGWTCDQSNTPHNKTESSGTNMFSPYIPYIAHRRSTCVRGGSVAPRVSEGGEVGQHPVIVLVQYEYMYGSA